MKKYMSTKSNFLCLFLFEWLYICLKYQRNQIYINIKTHFVMDFACKYKKYFLTLGTAKLFAPFF